MAREQRQIVVGNRHGLHARPAMQLVDLANQFQSAISLTKSASDGQQPVIADAKSVMAVITLAATPGTHLQLEADGPDAQQAVAEIAKLFDQRFGEDEE